MILQKNYNTSARWDKENNKWDIADRLTYQWTDNKNKTISPEYEELNDALRWIIEYDTNEPTENPRSI